MTRGGKDSGEVVEFMTLFARLKDWTDDMPEELEAHHSTGSRSVSEKQTYILPAAIIVGGFLLAGLI